MSLTLFYIKFGMDFVKMLKSMGCDTKEDTEISQTNGKQIGEIIPLRSMTWY